ncbi:MAG: sulfatase-like hydrolase/transferase [Sedimentisphaerales bacterium]|nr:sulfatase-like hydrolase/transferase [Sedimentisphaerales bacterium]MBN2842613.1 sulfatase-like hydrolase/transferase [Sedimentisphaerales bacterium]
MFKSKLFLFLAAAFQSVIYSTQAEAAEQPNIVMVFIDDMGWGDFSCFGNTQASTPNIDALAEKGIRFENFYVNSPICSPSRTALLTGCYPHRYRITSYLEHRQSNERRGMVNWLDAKANVSARHLHNAGYATGHFGKWHMGGQRDVDNAPAITEYGFDESLTNFEGMGPKLLPLTEVPDGKGGVKKGRIWEDAQRLGGPHTWMLRSEITGGFVDGALKFIDKAKAQDKPFYINLWPDDVHSPFFPTVGRWSEKKREIYLAVLEEMDQQLGRLFDKIKNDPALCQNTVILICSDNGPEPGAGSAAHLRGVKGMLYEGGLRSSLIAWAPGLMNPEKAGTVNKNSVFAAIDLSRSLLPLAGVEMPATAQYDGEDMSDVLLGKSEGSRASRLFFRRPPDRKNMDGKVMPDLAVREGNWKLLCDYNSENVQLFDLATDPSETKNLADERPELAGRLVSAIMAWNAEMPQDAGNPDYKTDKAKK